MWIVIFSLGLYLLIRGVIAVFALVRNLPRNNNDWIFY